MTDQAAPGVTPPVVAGNEEAARTETGAIKDQQGTQAPGTANKDTVAEKTTSTEKTATEKTQSTDDKTKKPDPAVVPDKYDLKAPEGKEIDAKLLEEVTPMFKELGLTQDQAQKLTDFWNKHAVNATEASFKAYEDMRTANREAIVKDPTLGNGTDGFKPEVKANIAKAMAQIGTPAEIAAFKDAMDLTGAGDHPAFAKAFNTLGKLLSEGKSVQGGGPSAEGQKAPGATPPTAAQAMYPKLPSSAQS